MTAAGVPAGAAKAFHDAASNPGTPASIMVGISGTSFERAVVVMARARDRVRDVPALLEQPPDDDSVGAALLWSAWRGHLSPRNAYRAQILRLARLGAIELRAEGLVTDPKDLTIVRRMEALELPTAADQDFMWLLFGREDPVEEVSIRHPKPRATGQADLYTKWYTATKERSKDLLRRIRRHRRVFGRKLVSE